MAETLTRAGFAAISIDHWGFGERKTDTETHIACNMLWSGQVMWGMMVYDSLRTVDYLMTRPDVDPKRIGTTGMSMGSTMAWWLAALDTRIACCVDVCCLTEFSSFLEDGGFHAPFYYVPGLLKHFTTTEINELIVPRPHLALEGNNDPLTPSRGLDIVDAGLKVAYRAAAAEESWQIKRYPIGHEETEEMRSETIAFLTKWLSRSEEGR